MLAFPPLLIPIPHHPGYMWEPNEEMLYSFKSGILKPLKYYPGNYWNHNRPGFQISTKGRPHILSVNYLKRLCPLKETQYVKVKDE